ncbi:37483_t:CDS:2 [Gigaspora margarita]|uniref:37483_t:CDS:1 n=1 Tax=Gigaspora margarita TaxID=4874 RepID=A0ABN7UNX4_GIGMA|nr:37483_t:CDS:2 [Gigaspora margarita]
MPITNVHISKGSKTLHGWYAHPIPYEMSIKEFFDKLIIDEISPDCDIFVSPFETIDCIELSQMLVAGTTTIQASSHCQIIKSTKAFGLNIHYRLNTKWSLIESANAQEKRFVSCLCDIIWYINMHDHLKLKERSYHILELFMEFFGRANPESYKNSRKPFNAIELNLHFSIWKINEDADETTMMQQNTNIVNELQAHSPHYHTRTMRKNYFRTCDLILPKVKPAALRTIYQVPFKAFDAATENEIMELWETIHLIDNNPRLKEFIEHCCRIRYYSFTIKKCGDETCSTCLPLRCSREEFEQLHYIPDPTLGEDLHYKSFEELYGTTTTEEYRPLLKDAKLKNTKSVKTKVIMKHTMPFSPSSIRTKNVGITVICAKCEKLHLLFSTKKLQLKECKLLESFLDTILYTCGMSFHNTCDLTSFKSINPAEINISNDYQSNDQNNQPSDDQQSNDQLSNNLPSDDAAANNVIARSNCPYRESIDISDEEDINNEEDINEEENINEEKYIYEEEYINERDEGGINEEVERDINEEDEVDINEEDEGKINEEDINKETSEVRSKEISTEDPIYKLF